MDVEATGNSTGVNWENAFVTLDMALTIAISGDEIWVAAGIYKPTSWPNGGLDDRERHFTLKNDVAISILANTISLTPGTVSAYLSADRSCLIIHSLHADDPDEILETIRERYEMPLKEILE